MRKWKLYACLTLCALFFTGCSDASLNLKAEELEKNTFSINRSGEICSGIVEAFDKSYYDKTELEQYLQDAADSYNSENGKDSFLVDSFLVEDKIAKVVFKYKGMDDYKALNKVEAEYFTVEEAAKQGAFPGKLKQVKDGEFVSKKTVEENSDYHVLVLNEEYDVRVSGKIYYYVNCTVYNNKSVHTSAEETSIIVYK
ncbi:hypothetical protein [Velocimicrobium porci]|uniref:Lipoprotein n=1 Tax=Velocimicrobium porci TaxID=2606634 RepID=A0A6L5XV82_9FIRM|nr:hypothetical protein [Velocimicrobium porci]MSS62534.1 hypothetical protein [Velocimicrobium porci]